MGEYLLHIAKETAGAAWLFAVSYVFVALLWRTGDLFSSTMLFKALILAGLVETIGRVVWAVIGPPIEAIVIRLAKGGGNG